MSIPTDVMKYGVLEYVPAQSLENFTQVFPEYLSTWEDRLFSRKDRVIDYIDVVQNNDLGLFQLLLDRDGGLPPKFISQLAYFVDLLVKSGSYDILKSILDSELISDGIKREVVALVLKASISNFTFLLNHDNEMLELARDYLPNDILDKVENKLGIEAASRLEQRL